MTHAPLNAQAENYLVLCEEVVRAKAMDWEIPTIWLDHSDQEMWVLCSYWWGQKRILPQGEGGLRAKIEQGLKDKKRLVIDIASYDISEITPEDIGFYEWG